MICPASRQRLEDVRQRSPSPYRARELGFEEDLGDQGVFLSDDVFDLARPSRECTGIVCPTVGDMVAILDTAHTRRDFPQGIGRKFVICSDAMETPPYRYKVEGHDLGFYDEDLQLTDHFIQDARNVIVKSKIEYEGKIPLVPGLLGKVMKTDTHGALIKFDESGVQWDHDVCKEQFKDLVEAKTVSFFKAERVIVKETIVSEGRVDLVPGLRGVVVNADRHGGLIRFEEAGVTWDHWVCKDDFVHLGSAPILKGPFDDLSNLPSAVAPRCEIPWHAIPRESPVPGMQFPDAQ